MSIPYSKIGYRIIQCRKRNCGVDVKTNGGRTKFCQKHGHWTPELEQKRQQIFAQEFSKISHHKPESDIPITQGMASFKKSPADITFAVPFFLIAGALLWQLYISFLISY